MIIVNLIQIQNLFKKKKVLLEFVNRVHVFSKALLTFFTVAMSIQGSRSHSNILTG